MEIVTIALIIIAVNMMITTLIFDYFMNLIIDNFKQQDKMNDEIAEHISNIYATIQFNGLSKPNVRK